MPADNTSVVRKTLKLVKIFEDFTEPEVLEFLRLARRQDVAADDIILREGGPGDDAYIVIAGTLRVLKAGDGVAEHLATLEPGDSFGELALLDADPRSATVVAETAGTLLRFNRHSLALHRVLLIKVLVNIGKVLAARLRESNSKLLEASMSRQRLARIRAQ
ncbi:MAG: cyclic nucleotide-binding domain-containing protein [Gammaproteobacteria bacterium]|nr:cyclic nucleotide-binding domain-containing protein [Gammaproteobacteria bacterium]